MRRKAGLKSAIPRGDGGFILVAVLWILIALATLVSIYAVYVINTAFTIAANDDRVNAEALFTAAVELTAYRLTAVPKETRPTSGAANFRMGQASVVLEFSSEAARIDLNAASKELLFHLFVVLGAQQADAEQYADRIVAWRTRSGSQNVEEDAESAEYRAAGRNYNPRRAPFQHAGELWLVLGLPPTLVERALPYLTVFNGRPEVNILDAPPVVIAALPGVTPEQLNALLGERQARMGQARTVNGPVLLELLGPARNAATLEGSKATRISVRVNFDNGRRVGSEIVILLNDDADEPYRVLSWRDDFDQIAPISR
jgi:general secretion pathway protein K